MEYQEQYDFDEIYATVDLFIPMLEATIDAPTQVGKIDLLNCKLVVFDLMEVFFDMRVNKRISMALELCERMYDEFGLVSTNQQDSLADTGDAMVTKGVEEIAPTAAMNTPQGDTVDAMSFGTGNYSRNKVRPAAHSTGLVCIHADVDCRAVRCGGTCRLAGCDIHIA